MYEISARQAEMWGMKKYAQFFRTEANNWAKQSNIPPISVNYSDLRHNQPIW